MKYLKYFWENGFSTDGRVGRKDFVITNIVALIVNIIVAILSIEINDIAIIGVIYIFASSIPFYTMAVKRCHDLNKNGGHIILLFIPLVSFIFMFYLFLAKSVDEGNVYGKKPISISMLAQITRESEREFISSYYNNEGQNKNDNKSNLNDLIQN